MEWTVHGERTIYDSEWMRLALVDVELPSGARFEHHVLRMPAEAAGVVVDDPESRIAAGTEARDSHGSSLVRLAVARVCK